MDKTISFKLWAGQGQIPGYSYGPYSKYLNLDNPGRTMTEPIDEWPLLNWTQCSRDNTQLWNI